MKQNVINLFLFPFKVIADFALSFKNEPGGYSGRKVSAAGCFITAFYMVYADKIPTYYRLHAFYALLITGLIALGLVTIPQLIQILNSQKNKDENKQS